MGASGIVGYLSRVAPSVSCAAARHAVTIVAARLSFFTSRDVIHTSRNWAYIISHRWLWPPLLLAGAVLSSILHNVLSGIFKIDEPVFLL